MPFIPTWMHLSHKCSSALAVRAMIKGQLRLRNFRILFATSNPSISGIWRSKRMIWKGASEGLRALKHSNPDDTADTWQPSLSSSFLVTVLFTLSSSASITRSPLNIELEFGCSEEFPSPKMDLPKDGWTWNLRTSVMLCARPWGLEDIQILPCIICRIFHTKNPVKTIIMK